MPSQTRRRHQQPHHYRFGTFARWVSGEKKPVKVKEKAGPGRPRKPQEIRELVVRLANENAWGFTRIHGELKKLGVRNIAKSTVKNILKEHRFDPGPKRGEGTWHDFVKRHASTLWACDFFTKNVWTWGGLVQFYILFFINIGTRRVHIAGITPNPDK